VSVTVAAVSKVQLLQCPDAVSASKSFAVPLQLAKSIAVLVYAAVDAGSTSMRYMPARIYTV
jgi:hypothetical protein